MVCAFLKPIVLQAEKLNFPQNGQKCTFSYFVKFSQFGPGFDLKPCNYTLTDDLC